MPTQLEILIFPTYNVKTLAVVDASTYDPTPPVVTSPTIAITPPGFATAIIPFDVDDYNLFTSSNLGLSAVGQPQFALPDGVYHFKYSIAPANINFVEKSIMRVDRITEKWDTAFLKLMVLECDLAIKEQSKNILNRIMIFIQGSVSAANNCDIIKANKLYQQADKMLDNIIKDNCGCS